jgi:hypothetical protein
LKVLRLLPHLSNKHAQHIWCVKACLRAHHHLPHAWVRTGRRFCFFIFLTIRTACFAAAAAAAALAASAAVNLCARKHV